MGDEPSIRRSFFPLSPGGEKGNYFYRKYPAGNCVCCTINTTNQVLLFLERVIASVTKYAVNAKWKRACLQDVSYVAWLAKDLCMTSVSLYNLLKVTE